MTIRDFEFQVQLKASLVRTTGAAEPAKRSGRDLASQLLAPGLMKRWIVFLIVALQFLP